MKKKKGAKRRSWDAHDGSDCCSPSDGMSAAAAAQHEQKETVQGEKEAPPTPVTPCGPSSPSGSMSPSSQRRNQQQHPERPQRTRRRIRRRPCLSLFALLLSSASAASSSSSSPPPYTPSVSLFSDDHSLQTESPSPIQTPSTGTTSQQLLLRGGRRRTSITSAPPFPIDFDESDGLIVFQSGGHIAPEERERPAVESDSSNGDGDGDGSSSSGSHDTSNVDDNHINDNGSNSVNGNDNNSHNGDDSRAPAALDGEEGNDYSNNHHNDSAINRDDDETGSIQIHVGNNSSSSNLTDALSSWGDHDGGNSSSAIQNHSHSESSTISTPEAHNISHNEAATSTNGNIEEGSGSNGEAVTNGNTEEGGSHHTITDLSTNGGTEGSDHISTGVDSISSLGNTQESSTSSNASTAENNSTISSTAGNNTNSSSISATPTATWGTQLGYDQPGGTEAICWKTTSSTTGEEEELKTEVMNSCGTNNGLWIDPPILEDGQERLWIEQSYRYNVHVALNLTDIATGSSDETLQIQSMALQILFCRVGQVSFCSPFVPEQLTAISDGKVNPAMHRLQRHSPYIESRWIHLPVPTAGKNETQQQPTLIQETFSMPTMVDQPGSYFVLAKLRITFNSTANTPLQTIDGNSNNNNVSSVVQWDMANGLPPNLDVANDPYYTKGRVVQYWDLPEIYEVTQGVRILSYVAVAIASLVILWLIFQTIKHRKNQVLHLSQAGFIVLFLVAALWATISTIFLEPKNDIYCQLWNPMVLIPIQLMYSITIGRLWRINAVISPLLVEHFRKNLSSQQRWTGKLVGWIHRRTVGSQKSVQLRRTVTSKKLAWVIAMFAVPQIVLQTFSVLLQPQERMYQYTEDGMAGVAMCGNGVEANMSLVNYGYGMLGMLLFLLLIMAYSCRNLPSLFNETHVIYTIIFRTIVFIVFGVIVVVVLQTQQNSVVAPDITYLLWLTIILYVTLASSLGLLLPKLRMIWNGEVVIVSKLVSDHHRARREKKAARASGKKGMKGMENVTGLDLSASGSNTDSYLNGSYNTEAYLNGSHPSSFNGSFTSSAAGTEIPTPSELISNASGHDKETAKARPKLSDIRESSHDSSCPRTMSANSDSSHWLPMASEDVGEDYEDVDPLEEGDDSPGDGDDDDDDSPTQRISPPRMGEWRNRMKGLRDKWNSKSMQNLGLEDSPTRVGSRPSSEFLPTLSTAEDDVDGAENDELVTKSEFMTVPQKAAMPTTQSKRKEYRKKKQRSKRRKSSIMVVSPDETPPRRLVLKMMDQHDCLTSITTKIMSGLSVRPEEWDKLLRLHTILEKCLQEEVNFTWRKEKPKKPEEVHAQKLERAMSTRSLKLSDLEDLQALDTALMVAPEGDEPSLAGNSRDDTLRRANTNYGGTFKKLTNLSQIAKEFKRIVDVRDRKWGLGTTYKDCFIACDAVDSLIYAGLADSREEAVEIGRRLAEEKHLFRHVTGDHDFGDKYLFFEFYSEHDSCCSSDDEDEERDVMGEESLNLFDINETRGPAVEVKAFRDAVSVRDRRYHLKLYPKVFVGCEAVDALIYHGVAKSRWEAVQLGRRLAREHKLFKHVCNDHEFRDEHLFYRFNELDENGVESSLGSAMSDSANFSQQPKSHIAELADAFEMYVDIRDRWYRTKKYKTCFIGQEAVDAMIYAGLADTREAAVALGRRLEKELRLFSHVCGDHEFKDQYLFYSLRRDGPAGSLATGHRVIKDDKQNTKTTGSDHGSHGAGSSDQDKFAVSVSSSSQGEKQMKLSQLHDKANAFRHCAVIQTAYYHMKAYKNVFIGCDTVDRMVWTGLAKDRFEAVQIARTLARELRLFSHVCNDHAFCDKFLFYRFKSEDDSSSNHSLSTLSKNSTVPKSVQPQSGDSSNTESKNNNSTTSTLTGRTAIAEKAELFRSLAQVKDRRYRLRTYPNCFVGSQVVDALVQGGVVDTREEAVDYGRHIQQELRFFKPVGGGDHVFKDEYIFYRFRDLGFKDGIDLLGHSINSANQMSVSSTVGFDTSAAQLDADVMDIIHGTGHGFGLPEIDENKELGAGGASSSAGSNEDGDLPDLVHYDDVDRDASERINNMLLGTKNSIDGTEKEEPAEDATQSGNGSETNIHQGMTSWTANGVESDYESRSGHATEVSFGGGGSGYATEIGFDSGSGYPSEAGFETDSGHATVTGLERASGWQSGSGRSVISGSRFALTPDTAIPNFENGSVYAAASGFENSSGFSSEPGFESGSGYATETGFDSGSGYATITGLESGSAGYATETGFESGSGYATFDSGSGYASEAGFGGGGPGSLVGAKLAMHAGNAGESGYENGPWHGASATASSHPGNADASKSGLDEPSAQATEPSFENHFGLAVDYGNGPGDATQTESRVEQASGDVV